MLNEVVCCCVVDRILACLIRPRARSPNPSSVAAGEAESQQKLTCLAFRCRDKKKAGDASAFISQTCQNVFKYDQTATSGAAIKASTFPVNRISIRCKSATRTDLGFSLIGAISTADPAQGVYITDIDPKGQCAAMVDVVDGMQVGMSMMFRREPVETETRSRLVLTGICPLATH